MIAKASASEVLPKLAEEPIKGKQVDPQILGYLDSIFKQERINGLAKPMVIDFWASWCTVCLKAMPRLDSANIEYSKNLNFLSVTYETSTLANNMLNRIFTGNKPSFKLITDDKRLNSYFKHHYLPHLVWIDEMGIYRGLVKELDDETIKSIINNETEKVKLKAKYLEWSPFKPLYATGQASFANPDELQYHSIIAKGREDLNGVHAAMNNFIINTNTSILKLYQIAYGKMELDYLDPSRSIILGLKTEVDSAKIGMVANQHIQMLHKKLKPLYTYELVVPKASYTKSEQFEIMQQDLDRYFSTYGIKGRIEKKRELVITLELIDKGDISAFVFEGNQEPVYSTSNYLKLKGTNMAMLLTKIRQMMEKQSLPLIDRTGYKKKIAMELNVQKTNITGFNECLKKYNLVLKKKKIAINYLVIDVDRMKFESM